MFCPFHKPLNKWACVPVGFVSRLLVRFNANNWLLGEASNPNHFIAKRNSSKTLLHQKQIER
jgi:hypothetical protein